MLEVRAHGLGFDDLLELSPRQFFNVVYLLFLEVLPDPLFDRDDTRRKYVKLLAWPDDAAAMQTAEESAMTQQAMAAAGMVAPDEADYQRAWDARQAALAEKERRRMEAEVEHAEGGLVTESGLYLVGSGADGHEDSPS